MQLFFYTDPSFSIPFFDKLIFIIIIFSIFQFQILFQFYCIIFFDMKRTQNVLQGKYSDSALKLKQIIVEGTISSSNISQLTSSPNKGGSMVVNYLNLSKRLNFLFKSKTKSYLQECFRKIYGKTSKQKQKQIYFSHMLSFFYKEAILRNKIYIFHKLCENKTVRKSKQDKKKTGMKMLLWTLSQRQERNKNTAFLLIRIKIYYKGIDNIKSKQSKSQMQKTQKQHKTQSSEQQLQTSLLSPLRQLTIYDRSNFVQLTLSHLKLPIENQIVKYENARNLSGKQLLLVVLNNHIKAIIDLTQTNSTLSVGASSRRSFNQKITVGMYQQLGNQFYENDQQLNKLIIISSDFPRAQGIIQLAIKNYTSRNYRFKNNKIIQSRVKLLELLLSLLRVTNEQDRINHVVPPLPQLRNKKTSFQELEVSYVRLIVQQLDQKVYELSTISEQIPQLETFKRTLDLTMPEHNVYLARIVDVLIELHHKINKLISRRPQKLLRQIQAVEQQCLIIEIATSQFIQKLESDSDMKIKPIYFDQRNNKSPDHFRKIQKNVVRLSQFILECLDLEGQARYKIQQIKALVEVFWNLLSGVEEYQRQWMMYKNRENKSPEEQQIIQLLQLCLRFVNDRWDKQNEEFEMERQALIDGNTKNIQFLQQDIAKMSRQNDELRVLLEQEERQNQQLRGDFVDFEKRYNELAKKYQSDVNEANSKSSTLEKKQKNYKDRIQSLESQNEQKKVMIANITNDLKRAMRQLENSQKSQNKNRNLQQTIDGLNAKIQGLEQGLKQLNQDYQIVNQQKQQFQKNNELIIHKLEEANRRITDLQNQIDTIKHKNQRQKSSFKQQFEQLQRKNRKLNQQLITNSDYRTKQNQKKDTQFKNALSRKDDKISQLNSKILELNNKLNELLDKHRDFDFELKRKQRNLQDLQNRLQKTQQQKNLDYEQLLKNYQVSQKQLTLALEQIQKSKSIILPQLEQQLKRRENLLQERQKVFQQQFEEQRHLAKKLKKKLQETEQKLENKQQGLQNRINQLEALQKQKQIKIRELQFALSINNSRINQLQTQLRIGNQQKSQLDRQLSTRIDQIQNDLRRIKQLEYQLENYDRDLRRMGELEGKLLESDRDRLRLQQLQGRLAGSEQNKNRLVQLQMKAERDRLRIQQLQGQILTNDKNKQRILQLQGKLSAYDKDKQKLYELQSKLSASQRERQRLQEQEARLSAGQRESRLKLQNLQARLVQAQKDKQKLQQLEGKLSANEREIQQLIQLEGILQSNERDRQRLHQQLMIAERERSRLHEELVLGQRDIQRLQEEFIAVERKNQVQLQQLQAKNLANSRQLQSKLSAGEREKQRLMQLELKLSAYEKDKLRLQDLQAKLSTSQRDRQRAQELQGKLLVNGQRLQELESRLSTSQRERQRLHELQARLSGSQRDKQRLLQLQAKLSASQRDRLKLQDLQGKLYSSGQRLQQLESLLSTSDRDRQRLNQQLAARQRDNQLKLQQLEAKLSASDRDKQKLRQLQLKTANYQQELRNQRNSDSQNLRLRGDYEQRIKQLNFSLNDALGKLQRSRNLQQRQRLAQIKVLQLQQQLRNIQSQLINLRQAQSARFDQNSKINSLESALNQKNRKIVQLENKIRNLEYQISQLQRQSDKLTKLLEDLRNKQKQLSSLRQQISSLQSNKGNQLKLLQNTKQIEYLKQKIRSLEDLIDIFTEQHGILEAKIKQYRFRQQNNQYSSANTSLTASSATYQNLSQEYNKLIAQNRSKDEQISKLKNQIKQLNQNYSPIRANNLFQDSASKSRIDESQRQIRQLKQKNQQAERKYQRQYKNWINRQRQFIEQINRVKSENQYLNNKMRSDFNVDGDKYYLRVQGQKLEELIRRMENGSLNMNIKIDQILSNSRRNDSSVNSQNIDVHEITQQNKILIQQIRNIMRQKQQLSSIVKDYPNPDFITEYAFRIVTYFSQIHPESPQGKCIWQQLQRIRKLNIGEQYFVILEQFTKYTLQESAIEIYRKQLKHKSKELELVKQRIDSLFNSQFSSERAVFQKTALTQSRIMMFREKFMNVLNVENGHSQIINHNQHR